MTERPLAGRTILVVASEERAEAIATALRRAGADAIPFPTVRIAPAPNRSELDRALRTWRSNDWVIFTSTNGVRATIQRARALRLELRTRPPRIAAVGPATKAVAESEGLAVDAMPDEFRTDAIADVLGPLPGRHVLLLRSSLARRALADRLRAGGADVEEVDAYEARPSSPDRSRLPPPNRIDLIVFTSGSAVQNLIKVLPREYVAALQEHAEVACIGPVTAEAAQAGGFRVAVVAREHTVPGLVRAFQEVPARG